MKKLLQIVFLASAMLLSHPVFAQNNWERKPEWQKHFRKANVSGSLLLFDLNRNRYSAFNIQRAKTRFLPASTFKIANSLIGLQTGAVRDENEVFKWDGKPKGLPDWDKDQDMKTAFANSTVWFYQRLARRIGPQRMQEYLRESRYGNAQIGGGIDQFWLKGDLRISSPEQIDFLVRLHQNKLPFSQKTMDIVKRIMVRESTDQYILRAKTGLVGFDPHAKSSAPRREIGWIVGYVERRDNAYFFATNLEVTKQSDVAARLAVTKAVLREMKIIE